MLMSGLGLALVMSALALQVAHLGFSCCLEDIVKCLSDKSFILDCF